MSRLTNATLVSTKQSGRHNDGCYNRASKRPHLFRTILPLVFLVGFAAAAHGQLFTPVAVNGNSSFQPFAINRLGQIAIFSPSGILDSAGHFTPINVPGSTYTYLYGISADGKRAVGAFRYAVGTAQHIFLWNNGVFTTIDVPASDGQGAAGISSNGKCLTGWYITGDWRGPNPYHAFLTCGGGFTLFDFPGCGSGNNRSSGNAVTDAGDVVGNCNGNGFLRRSDGSISPISFPGASSTIPHGISNNGVISGHFTDSSGKNHGFVLQGGRYKAIDVPRATQTVVQGISDVGDVVGTWTDSSGSTNGFMYGGKTSYVSLKYKVVGVIYAAPGPSSTTDYSTDIVLGSTEKVGNSVSNSTTISASTSYNSGNPGVLGSQITETQSSTSSQTVSNNRTVTTGFTQRQGQTIPGTGNAFSPVNSDWDLLRVWLNPTAIFTVYEWGSVVWNGYGFDMADQPDMEIVDIPLGYLNGNFGRLPPQLQTSIARAWAAGQVFPSGQGPALTSAELAQIASFDPFSDPTYGASQIGFVPSAGGTPDGRYIPSVCSSSASVPYVQAAPSGGAVVYTCKLTYTNSTTQVHGLTTSYSQSFSVDKSTDSNWLQLLTSALKAIAATGAATSNSRLSASPRDTSTSNTLTWTMEYQTSITTAQGSYASLSIQGPACGNTVSGQGPCVPVYDASGDQPTQFVVYVDTLFGTFYFAPVHYYSASVTRKPTLFTVSGTITDSNGSGISRISVTLTGGTSAATVTATDGSYQFTSLASGNYVVTPTGTDYAFSPTNQSLNLLTNNQIANFAAVRKASQVGSVLNFPKLFSPDELPHSGFAIVNAGPNAASITFTLYSPDGTVVSTHTENLGSGTQLARTGDQLFSTFGSGGWIQITSSSSGLQGFWVNYDSALTYLDGAAAAVPAINVTVPLVAGNTEVNIANPNSTAAVVSIELIGSNGKPLVATVTETIPANGVFHADAFALFNVNPVPTQTCYVRVLSGGSESFGFGAANASALAVTAVVKNVLVPREDAVINGVDESSTATQFNVPHAISGHVQGAHYTTLFGLTNLSDAPQTVNITFFTASGAFPIALALPGRGTVSDTAEHLFNLPPNVFENGWIQAKGTAPLTGFVAYAELVGGAFTVVPAKPSGTTDLLFAHIANMPPWATGIALLNPGTTTATVRIWAMTPSGALIGGPTTDPATAVFTLAPGTKTALGLSEMIRETAIKSATPPTDGGFVYIQSTVPIYGIELFYNDDFTIVSNVAAGELESGTSFSLPGGK
jgi:hypothetical protein